MDSSNEASYGTPPASVDCEWGFVVDQEESEEEEGENEISERPRIQSPKKYAFTEALPEGNDLNETPPDSEQDEAPSQ